MLGSLHDADDALQEALLGAWKGIGGFEGRSSVRSWLFQPPSARCSSCATSWLSPPRGRRPPRHNGPRGQQRPTARPR
ncbi:MAG: sigma factor [Streptomycetales bacterium]